MRRYHVQRATTKEWLSRDMPLLDTGDASKPLSKVGTATFACEPDIGQMPAADGLPMFDQWGSIITVETDGDQIPWRGIVTDMGWQGKTWTITADSMSTYPHGMVFESAYSGAEVDPADIVRLIWAHLQGFPDGNLGVVVTGSTGLKVGSYSTQDKTDTAAAYKAANDAWHAGVAERNKRSAAETAARTVYSTKVAAVTAASKALTTARATKDNTKIAAAQATLDAADAARDAQRQVVDGLAAKTDEQAAIVKVLAQTNSDTYAAKVAASKAEKDDGGAVKLNWWEAPDCGQTIDTLASDYLFEWRERHTWKDAAKSDVLSEIVIAYPRFGRQRTDLYFEQGVNITVELSVEAEGDDFANNANGIGAGEGAGSIRRSTGVRDGRLRRVAIVTAKDAKTTKVLDARISKELRTHREVKEITSVHVIGTDQTPIGSWETGDDILLRGNLPHLGEIGYWHRITDWKLTAENEADLTVARSDSFTYGG